MLKYPYYCYAWIFNWNVFGGKNNEARYYLLVNMSNSTYLLAFLNGGGEKKRLMLGFIHF